MSDGRWRPRWHHSSGPFPEQGRVQSDGVERRIRRDPPLTLPMPILEQAWKEYDAQGHGSQSLRQIQERGGFGLMEVVRLLADRCERLERRRG